MDHESSSSLGTILISALTAGGVAVFGPPWVEKIKGANQRKIVELDYKKQQIFFWKLMIPEQEDFYLNASPKIKRFRKDANILNLIPYMDADFKKKIDELVLPGEFTDGVSEDFVLFQQEKFMDILNQISVRVSELEHEWFFDSKK